MKKDRKECYDALIKYVNICFYYKDEELDSIIMERLEEDGTFSDGFINTHLDGFNYGFNIRKGTEVTLNGNNYVVDEVQFTYYDFNETEGIFPLYIKVYLIDK